jgi:hypothetical protein
MQIIALAILLDIILLMMVSMVVLLIHILINLEPIATQMITELHAIKAKGLIAIYRVDSIALMRQFRIV